MPRRLEATKTVALREGKRVDPLMSTRMTITNDDIGHLSRIRPIIIGNALSARTSGVGRFEFNRLVHLDGVVECD